MNSRTGSKKRKLWLSTVLILMLSILVSACSGNGGGNNTTESASPTASGTTEPTVSASTSPEAIDTFEPVTLKLVLVGTKSADTDEVYAEVNKIMKEKINATLEVRFLDWNEYSQKYPLMFAANEEFDLALTGNWLDHTGTARKGGFLELTEEMIKKYMPQTWAQQPPLAFEQSKVDGKLHMISSNAFESGFQVAVIRGDLREKYNLPEVKSLTDFVNFLTTVAKNEKGMTAFGGPSVNINPNPIPIIFGDLERAFVHGSAPLIYELNSPNPKISNYLDDPEYAGRLEMLYEMAQNGVWEKDSIVSKTVWLDAFKEGKTAAFNSNILNAASAMEAINLVHPEWKPEVVDIHPSAKRTRSPFNGGGIAIHATSKNPERALMALDLLRYDKEIWDLTVYGIEGKHWEPVSDTKFKSLPASTGFPPDGVSPWGWRTQEMIRQLEGLAGDLLASTNEKWKANNIVDSKLATFVLDDTNIKNELAALANVQKTYLLPIFHGLVKPADGIPLAKEKLKEAGLDKVQAEMQKQIDAFIQSNP
ncbi:putative aldouronate transport system substrate-binding protein [Paenibacillus endophyticus]|uniref:Putative aldouronate transport system substrate-binding protein n=1 Tax=Paenibacillus endophyticus TaxID=1294268 RepID=A0A7W5GDD7_9BACL|nr:ABC transporter substrate-binding protein [Paenibacillus endophyticus]MBB3155830.1 putative aldouronate transport system substrate-binding protein [Paenibacillus endophyticus]